MNEDKDTCKTCGELISQHHGMYGDKPDHYYRIDSDGKAHLIPNKEVLEYALKCERAANVRGLVYTHRNAIAAATIFKNYSKGFIGADNWVLKDGKVVSAIGDPMFNSGGDY